MSLFGKSKAWQHWISDNLDALMLYAKWQARNEADAEDILQWVLEKTWKDYKSKEPGEIYALVCKKIRHRTIDYYRSVDRQMLRNKKYGELTLIQSDENREGEWFGNFIEAKESQRILIKELRKLSEDLQEVVILHTWNDLSFRDIAEIIGISKSTVGEKYGRAIAELKTQLNTMNDVCNF